MKGWTSIAIRTCYRDALREMAKKNHRSLARELEVVLQHAGIKARVEAKEVK